MNTFGVGPGRTPTGSPSINPALLQTAATARAGLAEKIGAQPDDIRITGARFFTTGPSLGIGERDMGGAAVMVDAYMISFNHQGERYEYRAAQGSQPGNGKFVQLPDDPNQMTMYWKQDGRGIYVPDNASSGGLGVW